jgi:hypothetical protein
LAERHQVHEMVRMTAADTLLRLRQVTPAGLAALTGIKVCAPVQHAAQHSGQRLCLVQEQSVQQAASLTNMTPAEGFEPLTYQ